MPTPQTMPTVLADCVHLICDNAMNARCTAAIMVMILKPHHTRGPARETMSRRCWAKGKTKMGDLLACWWRASRQGGACRVLLQEELSVPSFVPARMGLVWMNCCGYEHDTISKAGTGAGWYAPGRASPTPPTNHTTDAILELHSLSVVRCPRS